MRPDSSLAASCHTQEAVHHKELGWPSCRRKLSLPSACRQMAQHRQAPAGRSSTRLSSGFPASFAGGPLALIMAAA